MTQELKAQFINRGKSFLWRIGMMALAFLLAFALDNLTAFNLDPNITLVLGLVLGEVSKLVNSAIQHSK